MKNYVELATRTESVSPTFPRLLHCALGLVTEVAELEEHSSRANAIEEVGDVYWYIAIGVSTLGKTWDDLPVATPDGRPPLVIVADLVDQIKTNLYYNRPLDEELFLKRLGVIRSIMVDFVLENNLGTEEDIMQANIAKLARRYPDGFSDWNANNRPEGITG